MQLHIHEGAIQNAMAIYLSLYGNSEFPITTNFKKSQMISRRNGNAQR